MGILSDDSTICTMSGLGVHRLRFPAVGGTFPSLCVSRGLPPGRCAPAWGAVCCDRWRLRLSLGLWAAPWGGVRIGVRCPGAGLTLGSVLPLVSRGQRRPPSRPPAAHSAEPRPSPPPGTPYTFLRPFGSDPSGPASGNVSSDRRLGSPLGRPPPPAPRRGCLWWGLRPALSPGRHLFLQHRAGLASPRCLVEAAGFPGRFWEVEGGPEVTLRVVSRGR